MIEIKRYKKVKKLIKYLQRKTNIYFDNTRSDIFLVQEQFKHINNRFYTQECLIVIVDIDRFRTLNVSYKDTKRTIDNKIRFIKENIYNKRHYFISKYFRDKEENEKRK